MYFSCRSTMKSSKMSGEKLDDILEDLDFRNIAAMLKVSRNTTSAVIAAVTRAKLQAHQISVMEGRRFTDLLWRRRMRQHARALRKCSLKGRKARRRPPCFRARVGLWQRWLRRRCYRRTDGKRRIGEKGVCGLLTREMACNTIY